MFKSVVEKDKYGRNQTRYYLTQGDSCVIYVKPYKNGQALPLDQIEKCVFKVSNEDYKQEFSKDLQVVDDYLKLLLTSQETNKLSVDTQGARYEENNMSFPFKTNQEAIYETHYTVNVNFFTTQCSVKTFLIT